MTSGKLTAIDLFAGSGGLSLGLRQAGFNVAAAVEIDPVASETYRKNHPNTKLLTDDVQNVDPKALAGTIPKNRLHLLAGCAPCQGFCSLTAKWARQDPRNRLVLQMARFVEELQPDAIFMENVRGLATRGKELVQELAERLRKAGYYAETRIVQMADFGVPQNRRRLVLLAGNGFMIPFPTQSHARDPEPGSGLKHWVTVRDAIYG
jgi:DNA (cytosine-5)-methyltransferase 1